LELGLKQSQQPKTKESNLKSNFSKRALTLGNGQMVYMSGQSVPAKVQQKSNKRNDRPLVKALQKTINKLNNVYNAGARTIKEDGIYGPNTAGALASVLSSNWQIGKAVAQYAKVDIATVKNVEMMRQRPNLIKAVYKVLYPIAANINVQAPPQKSRNISVRETAEQGISIPSDLMGLYQIVSKQLTMKDRRTGETTSAFNWFKTQGHAPETDGKINMAVIIAMIDAFVEEEQRGERVWYPKTTPQALQTFVRKRMGGRSGEHKLF